MYYNFYVVLFLHWIIFETEVQYWHSSTWILNKSLHFDLQQEKPKVIDPLDYEAVIAELGDELKEDPVRDLYLFPDNDFSVSILSIFQQEIIRNLFQ